jgi:hypothetical protein
LQTSNLYRNINRAAHCLTTSQEQFLAHFIATISAIVSLSLSTFAGELPSKYLSWKDQYKEARPRIVVIAADGGVCAGSEIGKGYVLTAAHCIPYLFGASVYTTEDSVTRWPAVAVAKDHDSDLALLLIKKLPDSGLKHATKDSDMQILDDLYTIGHPGLSQITWLYDRSQSLPAFTTTRGYIASIAKDTLRADITVNHGSSGGPLLNHKNEIVSVVSRNDSNFALGPTPEVIDSFLKSNLGKTSQLGEDKSQSSFDLYIWNGNHSYFKNTKLRHNINVFEFDYSYRNRYRFSLGGNGDSSLQVSQMSLGYKIPFISEDQNLFFLTPGLEHVSYLLNPYKKEFEDYDFRFGHGLYLMASSGRAGLALKLSLLRFADKTEQILSLGFYF